ncbi:MAG: endonuclease/exonuclease/phosphatase family protein [Mariniblastus sp.]|nr:endonuclease/exonuclease/phosphatase family protein [Mariniblastus sp.]
MKIIFRVVFFIAVMTGDSGESFSQQKASSPTSLRVMSFNIRNGKANDGDNSWEHRREFAADVIRDAKLDVIGLQEAFRFQLDDLRKHLPEFEEVGEGRDGGEQGEYSAILYRSSRFRALDSGTFWLSDTPEVKSRQWGNRYLRICTWVRLEDKNTNRCFYVYNTHFDHQSQNARVKSSQLIAQRIKNRTHENPFLVTGDFNADENNPVILYLKNKNTGSLNGPITLVDTFRQLHPKEKLVGTGGGFEGRADGKKIDYVFVQPDVEVVSASIIRTNRDGRYPSDHSPVMAEVRLSAN